MLENKVSLQDHIVEIDSKCGKHLFKLYSSAQNIQVILDSYFGSKNTIYQIKFDISTKYNRQLCKLINGKKIDFDEYVVHIISFTNTIQANINSENYTNLILKNSSIVKDKDKFLYKRFNKHIGIYFSIIKNEIKDEYIKGLHHEAKHIIKLERIKLFCPENIFAMLSNYMWQRLSLPSEWSIISFLFLTLLGDIILKKLNIGYFYSLSIWIDYFCFLLIIFGIPYLIYMLVRYMVSFAKIIYSYKLDHKYSNIILFNQSISIDKNTESMAPFNDIEKPITSPHEDLFAFNILSAHFYYNRILHRFDPNINSIIIIDSLRGMGKTSFLNLLEMRVYGKTYRVENKRKLFSRVMSKKQINVVKFSVLPLLPFDLSDNNTTADIFISRLINYISNTLSVSEAEYLKAIVASTKYITDKFDIKEFILRVGKDDKFLQLKKHLKLLQYKNILIIEDIDRLPEPLLKIFAQALWYIYELPFTITLLPCNAKQLRDVINLNNAVTTYLELEEYKLLKPDFSLIENLYIYLSHYAVSQLYDNFDNYGVKNDYIQLVEMVKNNNSGEVKNDWVKHLYDNLCLNRSNGSPLYANMVTNNPNISFKNSLIEDLSAVFERYQISIREFKSIFLNININSNLFVIQQFIFYIIEYRYKHLPGIMEYLNQYDTWGNYLKNRHLSLHRDRINNFYLRNKQKVKFSDNIKNIIHDLEVYPNISLAVNSVNNVNIYINAIFGLMSQYSIYNDDQNINNAHIVFRSEFIQWLSFSRTSDKSFQYKYNLLSKNWHFGVGFYKDIKMKREIVIAFNIIAQGAISRDSLEFYKCKLNIFLYQNLVILLLVLIKSDEILLKQLKKYFDKTNTHMVKDLVFKIEYYDFILKMDIERFINYCKILFNVDIKKFAYDESHYTLQKNFHYLKKCLIDSKASESLIFILDNIFMNDKENLNLEPTSY